MTWLAATASFPLQNICPILFDAMQFAVVMISGNYMIYTRPSVSRQIILLILDMIITSSELTMSKLAKAFMLYCDVYSKSLRNVNMK